MWGAAPSSWNNVFLLISKFLPNEPTQLLWEPRWSVQVMISFHCHSFFVFFQAPKWSSDSLCVYYNPSSSPFHMPVLLYHFIWFWQTPEDIISWVHVASYVNMGPVGKPYTWRGELSLACCFGNHRYMLTRFTEQSSEYHELLYNTLSSQSLILISNGLMILKGSHQIQWDIVRPFSISMTERQPFAQNTPSDNCYVGW